MRVVSTMARCQTRDSVVRGRGMEDASTCWRFGREGPSERQGQSLGSFSKLQTRRREANGAGTDISDVSSRGVS
jgi:hypothetical protein